MRIQCVLSHSKDSLSVVVFCYMLMRVCCFGLVVSTCQMIGWKDPLVTSGAHALILISRAGKEGSTVSSIICDRWLILS